MSNKRFTPDQEKVVCNLYIGDRLSANKLAFQFECSSSTIKTIIKRNGFRLRSLTEAGRGKFGKENSAWKGGKIFHPKGYIMIRDLSHPFRDRKGYVFEHRLVMEKHLRRFLKKEEVIHHINEIFTDNRIENLMLFPNGADHTKYHASGKGEQ